MNILSSSKCAAVFAALAAVCLIAMGSVATAHAAYAPGPPTILNEDDIAVVEGQHITLGEFNKRYKSIEPYVRGRTPSQRRAKARQITVDQLITQARVQLESVHLGIVASEQDVQALRAQLKRMSFPEEAKYQKFLIEFGLTDDDVTEVVRAGLQLERLESLWIGTVQDAEIVNEFRSHRRRYHVPEARDLRLVFNANRAMAIRAARKLRSGRSWRNVALRYSEDAASKTHGGRFPGVRRGSFPKRLDQAVFRARKGRIVGPVRAKYGYYVFKVTRVTKRRPRTLSQAKGMIRTYLFDRRVRERLPRARNAFDARWRPATTCRASHVTSSCGQVVP